MEWVRLLLRELTEAIAKGEDYRDIRGICYIAKETKEEFHQLPSFDECIQRERKIYRPF